MLKQGDIVEVKSGRLKSKRGKVEIVFRDGGALVSGFQFAGEDNYSCHFRAGELQLVKKEPTPLETAKALEVLSTLLSQVYSRLSEARNEYKTSNDVSALTECLNEILGEEDETISK